MPLKVSDGIGAWIKDFQKSDAPQFKNSSKEERRDQAIAAYLSAKGESVEENVKTKDEIPFDGPYTSTKKPRKDRYGNEIKRDNLPSYLSKKGIQTLIHYPIPPSKQKAYLNTFDSKENKISSLISETCLSLPIWPGMKMEEINYVIKNIKTFFN